MTRESLDFTTLYATKLAVFLTAKKGVVVVFVVVCMLLLFNINLYWRLADTCCWHDNCNISLVSLV